MPGSRSGWTMRATNNEIWYNRMKVQKSGFYPSDNVNFRHSAHGRIDEADPLLSMTALRAAAGGGREAIVDKSGPLATLAVKREGKSVRQIKSRFLQMKRLLRIRAYVTLFRIAPISVCEKALRVWVR
jgi:hypothetical protein